MSLNPVLSEALSPHKDFGIEHGFFTRQGGVSTGLYESLNTGMGSKDDKTLVVENRRKIAEHLGVEPTHLANCYQIHSAHVVTVTEAMGDERPQGDGLVTNVPGIGLGVLAADCGPILFADAKSHVIGACHAGWQGALTGVAENTIQAMTDLGAKRENIVAVLGPCISQKNYEVGAEFLARFKSHDTAYEKYFVPSRNADRRMFDLQSFIVDRLSNAGITAYRTGHCTYAEPENFFSYRRTTHREEPDYGRQMSVIALRSN